ncbi:MAG: LamG-like jellyroll fold domain-containing protein, partial [Limisphaerales bacterium]
MKKVFFCSLFAAFLLSPKLHAENLMIISQPVSQTVTVGANATFSVTANGSSPLSYQWKFNETNVIAGATYASLVLSNVQVAQAGTYSVQVTNALGSVLSSNAALTVDPVPSCGNTPSNLVAWWRAEGDTSDFVGVDNGTLVGNTVYGSGRVGQAFVFDGSGDGVQLGNPANLQLQNFTIETWIKRANTTLSSLDSFYQNGIFLGYGYGGYAFGMFNNGNLLLTRVGIDNVILGRGITDTNWHHVAVTKSGSTVFFFIDGVSYAVPTAYNTTYTFSSNIAIGVRGDNLAASFLGSIDELAIYSRPLSAVEIQAIYDAGGGGKCATPISPFVITQPASQTATVGSTATLSVTAGGSAPLSYQWSFNG